MYESDIAAVGNTAKNKVNFMENNLPGFFLMSMMAGLYIGLGSIFFGVIGGLFTAGGSYATKLVTGVIFSVGLCMVVICGAELFTGNNFVMAVGALSHTISWGKACKFWVICWLGNLAGSFITGALFVGTGQAKGDIGSFLGGVAAGKAAGAPANLLSKAILCNICVCVAIWGCARIKSEGAKFAMCFCCVTPFVACGYEHSVANMTYFAIGLLAPNGASVPFGGVVENLIIVTIGNMIGGICCVALPYYITGRAKK